MDIRPGDPDRLGASAQADGGNFALFSAHAEAVELCLFDAQSGEETARLQLPHCDNGIWHGFVPGLRPGACYGYRVHGPFDPQNGQRFNAHKLLLDPYAKQLHGPFRWHTSHFAFARDDSEQQDLSFSTQDNSAYLPKAVLPSMQAPPSVSNAPVVSPSEAVIYEAHVRGLTRLHPDITTLEQGRFAGMARSVMVDYLKALGITSLQLLPVQAHIDEHALHQRGLSNYWGYNTLAFFSPHPAYLSTPDILEFRRMVDTYHEAGIEVLLDVVYNHSCEGDEQGPTLSMRGIDNQSYYRLREDSHRFYVNDTGCGNTLNLDHPQVRRLIIDSLVYWVTVMGVDGFRFDLATVLGRSSKGFSAESAFFDEVRREPALARCKLIAEPWDIGPGGYQLGEFPKPWLEWNDQYRDSVRRFWRGDEGELPELARRLHGSADIFERKGRPPSTSVNYVASHDGFTLRDMVSFSERHNLANGENNRDGHGENFSANNGVEGPTDDVEINQLRDQQQRNFLAMLAISPGVPMLQAGDELGRSAQGNNNAYCQDTPLNWINWEQTPVAEIPLLNFARAVFSLRLQIPLLRPDAYRHTDCGSTSGCMLWFCEDGQRMTDEQWHDDTRHCLAYILRQSDPETGVQELLVLLNGGEDDRRFTLPQSQASERGVWHQVLNTANSSDTADAVAWDTKKAMEHRNLPPIVFKAVSETQLKAKSLQLFLPA